MEKRQYQEDAIKAVLESSENVLLVSPTGSGKTYMAKRICEGIQDRVLFVTPRIDLVTQTAEAFDFDCDILWKSFTDTGKHIVVASRQTLQRRDLNLSSFVAIFDEVHIGLPATKDLCDKFHFKRVIGLTATPERMDGYSFIKGNSSAFYNKDRYTYAVFDKVITAGTIKSLQDKGYLADLEYSIVPESKDFKKIKSKFDELRYEQFSKGVETVESKLKLAQFLKAHEDQKPYIIFTPDVKSAYYWRDEINKFGYKIEAIDGSFKKSDRDAIYEKLRKGELDGIVNCALLTYGFDLPIAKTAVLIRNIKSKSLYIQVIGRILRPYENRKAIVYDMGGSNWNFCTLKHPNLFDSDIEFKVEGTDEPVAVASDEFEKIESLVGSDKVHSYIEDPLQTLIEVLNEYKEDFEMKILETKKEVLKQNKDLQETVKVLEKKQEAHARIRDWFKNEGFNWSRYYLPQILRSQNYDASYVNNPEILKKIYLCIRSEMPFIVPPEEEIYFQKQIASLSKYWLNHFHLNWEKGDSHKNDVKQYNTAALKELLSSSQTTEKTLGEVEEEAKKNETIIAESPQQFSIWDLN